MGNNRNYAIVGSMIAVILAAAYIWWAYPISQPIQQNPTTQVGVFQASPIILCITSPDTSSPQICPRRDGTTISALSYATSIASNFACVGGGFSGTCNTSVTDAAGQVVLSGSSSGSSVCSDDRLVCQVPLDAPNMPVGTYRVTFTVVDNNSHQSTSASEDVTVVR